MTDIENIASKHLGKAGDGTVVKPYVTPDSIDNTLLVGVPRHLNRTAYGIQSGKAATMGVDLWNAYEVSFLLQNGFPVNCIVRLIYDADSECIVESKSLKLYLNSFNMDRFDTLSIKDAIRQVKLRIEEDLTPVIGVIPKVIIHRASDDIRSSNIDKISMLENIIDQAEIVFDQVNEDPSILKASTLSVLNVRSALLRSNCRVTNQPDWGDVYIFMEGENTPTLKSLAQYLVSMRKENHFHEEICECIYKRLHDKFKPKNLAVACLYTRRGGIDINPIRYSSKVFFDAKMCDLLSSDSIYKTVRQ